MNTKSAFPSDAADKVLVRMPDGMRDQLKESAKVNNRTMNAEIVSRLEQSFSPAGSHPASFGYAIDQMLDWTMEKEGVDQGKALERLVAKGFASDQSMPVFVFYAAPGMTTEEIRAAMEEANLVCPPDAAFFFESRKNATKPAP